MAVYTGKKMKFTHNGDTFILDPVSVFEYSDLEHFPAAGQAGKVYIALDTNVIYRWDETDDEYVPISSSGGSSAMTKIPFTIAISDWSSITGGYSAVISNGAFTGVSEEFITYTNSINTYLKGNLNAEKDSSDHSMTFITEALPIGTIAGTIYSVANYNGRVGVVMVDDKLPIANGGTNANTAAGALVNLGAIGTSEKGVANGVATLDSNGLIPASQLPSYVDDVLEYANVSSFPATGETGKIYVALDTNKSYRWSGSTYIELSTYDVATQSSSGLMSAMDKTNLDRVAAITAFVGATSSAAGTSGYVPAPTISDRSKVLTGNGTWSDSPGAKLVTVNGEMINGSGLYVETFLNNLVTADMKAVDLELSNPEAFLDQITVSSGAGFITVTCQSVSGSSTIKASLLKVIDDPTAITTTEYDVLDNRINNLWSTIYPVGSIYMSVASTSPSLLFGGTWEQLEDRFLIGAGANHQAGDTGGAESVSYTPGGTVENHTLTTSEIPSHNHTFTGSSVNTGKQSASHTHSYTDYYATTTGSTAISVDQLASHTHVQYIGYPNASGSGTRSDFKAIEKCQPLDSGIATGSRGGNAGHTHSGANTNTSRTSGGISADHTHSVTASGSIGNTGSGGAHNHGFTGTQSTIDIMPPYLSVYMWKRTA